MTAVGGTPANPLLAMLYSGWLVLSLMALLFLVVIVASGIAFRTREQRRMHARYDEHGKIMPPPIPHQFCTRWICVDRPHGRCPR